MRRRPSSPLAVTLSLAALMLSGVACDTPSGGEDSQAAPADTAPEPDGVPADVDADADTSAGSAGACSLELEGHPCDDGDPCTTEDLCSGGRCVGGGTLACDDPDPCRTGRCEPGVGCVFEALDEGAACSLACFTASTCVSGRCTPQVGSAKPCPTPADPCVDRWSCDSATGECSVPIYAPAGRACDRDEDLCTLDTCDGQGACLDTGALETCAAQSSNNPCWTYSCVKQSGCVRAAFVSGASCDDLNPCTGDDRCLVSAAGQQTCLGTPLPIDDKNPCTNDACVSGAVTHTPIDGVVCSVPGDLCLGAGLCAGGVCQAQAAVACDDGDPCTSDRCVPATGACAHEAISDGSPCDDGDACTALDRCVGGVCSGSLIANCCGNLVCEPGEGCTCADCEGQGCDDGDACTAGDHCQGGLCVGVTQSGCCGNGVCEAGEACACVADCETKPCQDGDACTSGDHCEGGLCVGSLVAGCCGNHLCELGEGCGCSDCVGAPCDDGNACTLNDSCGGGACQGGPMTANCCGNAVCEPGEGCDCADCEGQGCDDGVLCSSGGTCVAGACQSGGLLADCCGNATCDAGEGCGCVDCEGAPCEVDGACVTGGVCGGGVCQGGTPVDDCCGNGECEAGEGCGCADCEGEACDDGDLCTSGDRCSAGVCVGASVGPCCDDGVCAEGEGCACADCATTPACVFVVPEGFQEVSETEHIGGHGTLARLDDEYLAIAYTDALDIRVAPDNYKVRIARLVAGELQFGTPLVVSASMRPFASNSTWLGDIGLMGALGSTHFVLMISEVGQAESFRLYKRVGMNVEQVDEMSPFSLTDWWAGHPLDSTRYLLRYRVHSSDAPVNYKVIIRSGDSMSLSTYFFQRPPSSSFSGLNSAEPQTHAPLMRIGATTFREIRGGGVKDPSNLASWKLSVSSSSSLSSSSPKVFFNSKSDALSPMVVSNGSTSGVVFYRSFYDAWYWGALSASGASFTQGGYLHDDVSWHTGQNRESTDGYVGGKYYLRGVNGTLYRFDTLSSQPVTVETGLDWSFCRNTPPLVTLQGHAVMMTCDKTKPLLVRLLQLQ